MIDNCIEKYKKITEAIIVNLRNGLVDEKLLLKRQEVLEELLENPLLNKAEIKKEYINSGCEKLDGTLKEELEKLRLEVRKEINNLESRKNANSAYSKNINYINSFNTRI